LIWQVLVDNIMAVESSRGDPIIPKVLFKSVEQFGRSKFGFGGVDPRVLFILLTQNPHPASSTQQAEQASFTHEQIPKRASQFSLKINKRQSS
jgi:hypothetical protein